MAIEAVPRIISITENTRITEISMVGYLACFPERFADDDGCNNTLLLAYT